MPTGTWGFVAFDVGAVIEALYGDTVELAQIDVISIWGWGKTQLADFALLGETHAAYSAWGESLASPLTGDIPSPLARAALYVSERAVNLLCQFSSG